MTGLLIFLSAFAAGVVLLLSLPDAVTYAVIKENGPVETAQLIAYMAGAILSWIYEIRRTWSHGLSGGAILFIFALREMDLQTMFTGMSVIKTRFFITPEFSLATRLTAALILLAIGVFVATFVKRTIRKFLKALKNKENWAVTAFAGTIMLPLSLVFDGAKRYMQALGMTPGEEELLFFAVLEETSELAIPLLFLAALIQWGRGRVPDTISSED